MCGSCMKELMPSPILGILLTGLFGTQELEKTKQTSTAIEHSVYLPSISANGSIKNSIFMQLYLLPSFADVVEQPR